MGRKSREQGPMTKRRIVLTLGLSSAAILGAAALWMFGYPSHPDRLLLVKRGVALVDFSDYAPNWARSTPALALTFEGGAPFAAIQHEGRQAQFRCDVVNAAGRAQTETELGWVFFEGPAALPPNAARSNPNNMAGHDERYRYKAVLYPALKKPRQVNGPADFDLLTHDYDRIQCQLVGVRMIGAFMYSNELTITKAELVKLVESQGRGALKP